MIIFQIYQLQQSEQLFDWHQCGRRFTHWNITKIQKVYVVTFTNFKYGGFDASLADVFL